jgi:hypothetical protein
MPHAEVLLVLAVLVQMTTTIVVGFWLGWVRHVAVRDRTITGNVMVSQEGWPERARAASNNFSNQFEVPVIFYALALLALHLKVAGIAFDIVAWVFVVSRIAHAIAHCGPNDLRLRAPAYFVGVTAVIVMLVMVAVAALAAA